MEYVLHAQKRRKVVFMHCGSGQDKLTEPAVGYQVDYPVIGRWSDFQELKVTHRPTALISVSLQKTQTSSVGLEIDIVLIKTQSKQLRRFGKYEKIVYLFLKRIWACGNYSNIFRSVIVMASSSTTWLTDKASKLWKKTASLEMFEMFWSLEQAVIISKFSSRVVLFIQKSRKKKHEGNEFSGRRKKQTVSLSQ